MAESFLCLSNGLRTINCRNGGATMSARVHSAEENTHRRPNPHGNRPKIDLLKPFDDIALICGSMKSRGAARHFVPQTVEMFNISLFAAD
jgi:hypothetical protein